MLFGGDKHNVTLLVTLVIIISALPNGFGADVGLNTKLTIANHSSMRRSGESISAKMLQIRHLVKSLFSDWKLGESDFEGAVTRTFGFRFRMIRKIILPLAFFGGFMTAIILFIKATGVINMMLITKVLLLQKALVLGKVLWGLFSIFKSKHELHHEPPRLYPYPVYIPHKETHEHYGESSFAGAYDSVHSREDYNQQPNLFYSQQASNYQPLYSRPLSYRNFDLPPRNNPPQHNFGRPQAETFNNVPLETPQQFQFTHPYNLQTQGSQNYETRDNRVITKNSWDNFPDPQQLIQQIESPSSSYSPEEMTKILSDALARVASRPPRNSYSQRKGR